MIGSAKRLMGAGVLAAVLVCGSTQELVAQAAGRRAADPPVIAYRKAMMAANRQHIGTMRALLSGEISHPEDVKMHAAALADVGWMFAGIFPEGSTGPMSRAMEEIWTMEEDFAAKVTDLPPRVVPHPMLVPAPVEGREGRASSGTRATA